MIILNAKGNTDASDQEKRVVSRRSNKEKAEIKGEKIRKRILQQLESEHLLVRDGYDYESPEPGERLPTMFHGTSEYFLMDIMTNGLDNKALDPDKMVTESNRLAKQLREIFREHGDRKIHLSMIYNSSVRHAQAPERLEDLIQREQIVIDNEQNNIGWELDDLLPPEKSGYTRKLLLSVLVPKPILLKIRMSKNDLNMKVMANYDPRIKFFVDPDYRKEYIRHITDLKDKYRQLLARNGKFPLTNLPADEAWELQDKILPLMDNAETVSEVDQMTVGQIIEANLRTGLYELVFDRIPPENIVDIVRDLPLGGRAMKRVAEHEEKLARRKKREMFWINHPEVNQFVDQYVEQFKGYDYETTRIFHNMWELLCGYIRNIDPQNLPKSPKDFPESSSPLDTYYKQAQAGEPFGERLYRIVQISLGIYGDQLGEKVKGHLEIIKNIAQDIETKTKQHSMTLEDLQIFYSQVYVLLTGHKKVGLILE